jgi:formiminotetrahydrofolate cyclodeaminase
MPPERERGLTAYIDDVAAGTPTPGGGSVAAVVGALAAALGEMVANLTLGKAKYASTEETLRPARDQLTSLRHALLTAATADEAAYASYRAAAALPRGNETEIAARASELESALITATEVPLQVARAATSVAEILETVAKTGNPHLRSDTALGALLAEAALRGVLLNVRGNAAMLRDSVLATPYREEADRLELAGIAAAERALQIATERT